MKQKKKNKPNYFAQAIQRGGTDFIDNTNIQQLQNDASKILRELARGNIDPNQYYNYLANDRLAYALSNVAYQNLIHYNEIYYSLWFRVDYLQRNNQPLSQYLVQLMQEYSWKTRVYDIIYSHIEAFRATKDISHIISMVSKISYYTRYI